MCVFFSPSFFSGGWGGLNYKNRYKFLMHYLITLKFGTNKEHIKVNSGTEFGMNLISIQCVRSDDLCST